MDKRAKLDILIKEHLDKNDIKKEAYDLAKNKS